MKSKSIGTEPSSARTRPALRLAAFLGACTIAMPLIASEALDRYVPDPNPRIRERIEEWRDIMFGLLMHWGTYSQLGIVESWSICPEDLGWCVPETVDDYFGYKTMYENLATTFKPTRFDPARWAKAARDAGMKYVVFTTKHHDGFCMYDSKYTDYKITGPDSAFAGHEKADVTRAIFDAFREEGLWIGAYFSKPDWHNENFWWPHFPPKDRYPNYDVARYPERWSKFVEFTHNQVMELCEDYGKIDILWFDGGWVKKAEAAEAVPPEVPGYTYARQPDLDVRMDELVEKVRRVQPDVIVVDRAVPGKNQNYLTPENQVPEQMLPFPWESCIIMGGGWSYSLDPEFKTSRELVHMLADIVAKGGNLLLNIGPGPDGTWYEQAYSRLDDMGAWLRINGESIYNTRVLAPYFEGPFRFTKGRDGSLYITYLLAEGEAELPAEMALPNFTLPKGAQVSVLGGDGSSVRGENTAGGAKLALAAGARTQVPSPFAVVFKVSTP